MTDEKATASASEERSHPKRVPLAQRRKARRVILQALYQWIITNDAPAGIAKQYQEDTPGKIEWEYFNEVFPEIPKCVEILDEHLNPLLDRKPEALDPIEKSLLYLGCYELAFRIDVPYRVVINECVELAKVFGATDGHKYINGVLDKLAKKLRAIEFAAR